MQDDLEGTPLVRIAEIDDVRWARFKAATEQENEHGFQALLSIIEGDQYVGMDLEGVTNAFGGGKNELLIVADETTFEHPSQPVLCVDLTGESTAFRTSLDHLWIVENNVSTGNMLLSEIADELVSDGWLDADGMDF